MKAKYTEHSEDLFQNAPCGYLSMQADGEIVNINNTLLTWLNFTRKEVINSKSFQDLLAIGGKMYFETHMMPLLQMQGEVREINIELKGKNKTVVPVLINGTKVQVNPEHTIYRLSIIDISQRKMYEKELLKARKEAEDTNKRLIQINEELEHFAYTASHDLQAPLNNIASAVYLIKLKNLIQHEETVELFSVIENNANRMRTMIYDLLEYSKLDGSSSESESFSLEEVCVLAIEMLDDEIKKNGAEFNISDLPIIKGSKTQFIRLFLNFFSNAIKYRKKTDTPVIHVSCEKIRDYYTIYIKDNGIGFDQKHDKKIFQFMERLHSHDDIAGTGIGLSACKRIVEKHGGRIGVTSAPGQGSTFYFTLPESF